MSTAPLTPAQGSSGHTDGALPRWVIIAFVLAFVLVGYLLYADHSQRQDMRDAADKSAKQTTALQQEIERTNSRIADLKGELEVSTQKLNLTQDEVARARSIAQQYRKDQQTSDARLTSQIGQVQQETTSKIGEVSTDLAGTKSDVEATKKDLETTKGQLQRAMGDLGVQSGLIARNHDDVEELKRLGQRNYFEFDLGKTKSPQKIGPIMVQLKKTDTKHFRYTMNVIADDKTIEKKDKTVGEPVQFYVGGARVPYEIVVFGVTKDHAKGYLSTPKDTSPAPVQSPSN
ncbi:MAG: hypothetical protein ACRD50_12575 [Candidatus Acidiferrales bacterium]